MTIVNFTPWSALVGGALIGIASAAVVAINGRIPGISGVCARAMQGVRGDTAWRVVFLVGLVLGAAVALWSLAPAFSPPASLIQIGAAGLLVGFGARLGGGCTSGHGVCGIGRGSRRSIVATMVFMAAGMVTVWVMRHAWGGAS